MCGLIHFHDGLHLVVHDEHHGGSDRAENVGAGALEQGRVTWCHDDKLGIKGGGGERERDQPVKTT